MQIGDEYLKRIIDNDQGEWSELECALAREVVELRAAEAKVSASLMGMTRSALEYEQDKWRLDFLLSGQGSTWFYWEIEHATEVTRESIDRAAGKEQAQ